MQKDVILSPEAILGLEEIWFYIAQDNPVRADSFIDEIRTVCFSVIGSTPSIGRERPDLLPGIRSFPFKNYLILYREREDSIDIAQIVHGARDTERIFDK